MTSGARKVLSTSRRVKKLPRDFDIFSSFTRTNPLCIHTLTKGVPQAAQDCAISFSWCGNFKSSPPPCRSKYPPSKLVDMAEHSMCQPGRPSPHGEVQEGSPGLARFHSTKSKGSSLASSTCTREPARKSSIFLPESRPYAANLRTEYMTSPLLAA